jgi:glycine/D-amino acid oxidase-like deaminating enzyme
MELMPSSTLNLKWGTPPWQIDFRPAGGPIPAQVDVAVVGGGFTGLSAAASLRRLAPEKSVALFESYSIGGASSGHTGGMTLAETAVGDLPGLGDVLAGFSSSLTELSVDCDLKLSGVWEVARTGALSDSPISWNDSGILRAVQQVPGGTIDPGKLVSGLARAAENAGVRVFENAAVENIEFKDPLCLHVSGGTVRAEAVLLATNAMSLELNGLADSAQPKFTLAIATEPLTPAQLDDLGLSSGKPFYTVDFPYLWGRLLRNRGVIFGCGLVHLKDWRELMDLDISTGEPAKLIASLERRVRSLHPTLKNIQFTNRWGGPILIPTGWRPVFSYHPMSRKAIVLGGYSGHGVALSVYLGRWAAEALCGRRKLPEWNSIGEGARA